jgi:hypothetical protein
MRTPPSAFYCGDGVRQTSFDALVLPSGGTYQEECDNGDSNGLGSCSMSCACGFGFSLSAQGVCTCFSSPGFSVKLAESNRIIGEANEITVQLNFTDTVYGLTQAGNSQYFLALPVIITVSNLTGSLTPDGILPLSQCIGPWTDCGLGLAPAPGSSQWRFGVSDWQHGSGTLRLTILQTMTAKQGTISFSFVLRNPAEMQYARRPAISACTTPPASPNTDVNTPPLLGANSIRLSGPSAPRLVEISKVGMDGKSSIVVRAQVGAMIQGSNVTLDFLEELQITGAMRMRIQTGAAFAGLLGIAAINTDSQSPTSSSKNSIYLSVAVDSSIVSVRGGCSIISNRALSACIPGYVGVFSFDVTKQAWLALSDLNQSTAAATFVHSFAAPGRLLAVISVPPCSNVGGQGMPAGDKVQICFGNCPRVANMLLSDLFEHFIHRLSSCKRCEISISINSLFVQDLVSRVYFGNAYVCANRSYIFLNGVSYDGQLSWVVGLSPWPHNWGNRLGANSYLGQTSRPTKTPLCSRLHSLHVPCGRGFALAACSMKVPTAPPIRRPSSRGFPVASAIPLQWLALHAS